MIVSFLTQDQGKILGPFVSLMGSILNILYEFLEKFGITSSAWTIILMTFIINGLMIPLTIKQQKSSKLQSRMQPEIQAITKKYKGKTDQQSVMAQQAETRAVYDKYGTSMLSGCLPMLITLPIMLALYRVIYNIPAYVQSVKDVYENAAVLIQGNANYIPVLKEYLDNISLSTKSWGDISNALAKTNSNSINYIIDILAKLTPEQWKSLMNDLPNVSGQLQPLHEELLTINTFMGMNISDKPSLTSISVSIPILAVITQFISSKLMMVNNPVDSENPAAATMKSMNLVMPLVSGFMGLALPIGVGLYWVAGSVFRIFQQIFINIYFKKLDIDDMIEKNKSKAAKKKARKGDSSDKSLQNISNQKTSSIRDFSHSVKNTNKKLSEMSEEKDYNKNADNLNPNSISSIANMLGGKKN